MRTTNVPPPTNEEKLQQALLNKGFTLEKDHFRNHGNLTPWYAWRRTRPGCRPCECNSDKPGLVLVIKPYAFNRSLDEYPPRITVEVEICGQANGLWWTLKAYGIDAVDDLLVSNLDELEKIEASLVRAWNALTDL